MRSTTAFQGTLSHPPGLPSHGATTCRNKERRRPKRGCIIVQAGLWDAFKSLGDFESWAPRSSRAWRLGQDPDGPSKDTTDSRSSRSMERRGMSQADIDVLNTRLGSMSRVCSEDEEEEDEDAMMDELGRRISSVAKSFSDSTDEDFAISLNDRIGAIAASSSGRNRRRRRSRPTSTRGEDSMEIKSMQKDDRDQTDEKEKEEEEEILPGALTGDVLRDLIVRKYGKMHDVGFVRRDIPGKTLVSLNIYHAHLGQRSFPMREEDYLDKLDGVAMCLLAWDQAERVISFLQEPVMPRRGLPSRPIVGNAVSIRLELNNDQIAEYFGRMK